MRLALVLLCALAGACSAVDDFSAFRFGDGGAGGGADLAGASVGDSCTGAVCPGGLTCFGGGGNSSFPGGVCSASCSTSAPSCPTGTGCAQIGDTTLCLAACNPSAGVGCRAGWSCCDGQRMVPGPGLCGPSNSNFCGH